MFYFIQEMLQAPLNWVKLLHDSGPESGSRWFLSWDFWLGHLNELFSSTQIYRSSHENPTLRCTVYKALAKRHSQLKPTRAKLQNQNLHWRVAKRYRQVEPARKKTIKFSDYDRVVT